MTGVIENAVGAVRPGVAVVPSRAVVHTRTHWTALAIWGEGVVCGAGEAGAVRGGILPRALQPPVPAAAVLARSHPPHLAVGEGGDGRANQREAGRPAHRTAGAGRGGVRGGTGGGGTIYSAADLLPRNTGAVLATRLPAAAGRSGRAARPGRGLQL